MTKPCRPCIERKELMDKPYNQLSLKERQEIEDGLDRGDSFREIARTLDRSASTISREVKENRALQAYRARKGSCREANWCKRAGICADKCLHPGARCAGCDKVDCRDVCPEYALHTACGILCRAPWVCNACGRRRRGCNRANRFVYDARLAHEATKVRRSESRSGIDMDQARAQAALALYSRPTHLQLALLLGKKTCDEVVSALKALKKAAPERIAEGLFGRVLTDNGDEFADEAAIGRILGEGANPKAAPHLYYCDPRASQQKAGCEKNHSELRQILKKGMFVFDDLDAWDLAVVMSQVNSAPRQSLCGLSPIQMFCAAYGGDGEGFLASLGVEQLARDEIVLKPSILDTERAKRGKEPVKRVEKKG